MGIFNKNKKNASYPDDDGRTIADMNVDGMPWYVRGDEKRLRNIDSSGQSKMTDEELRLYKLAALKSALLVALVFGVVFFIFIAFCDFVWFR